MKLCCRVLLLSVPLLALPAQAHADGCGGCGFTFGGSITLFCKPLCGGGCCGPEGCGQGGSCAPWYSYWPHDNHFATPAHPEFPYWPQAMTPVISNGQLNGPAPAHPVAGFFPSYPAGAYQPVSYPTPSTSRYQNPGVYQPVSYPSYNGGYNQNPGVYQPVSYPSYNGGYNQNPGVYQPVSYPSYNGGYNQTPGIYQPVSYPSYWYSR